MYTTYDFYINEYFGDVIQEADFKKWATRASDKLDVLTFNHITDQMNEDERLYKKIQKATCALADILCQIDTAEQQCGIDSEGKGKIVKSRTAGSESESYDVGNTLIYSVLSNKTSQNKLLYSAIIDYLSGTGLLYAGLDYFEYKKEKSGR